jgi:hypothetical protein
VFLDFSLFFRVCHLVRFFSLPLFFSLSLLFLSAPASGLSHSSSVYLSCCVCASVRTELLLCSVVTTASVCRCFGPSVQCIFRALALTSTTVRTRTSSMVCTSIRSGAPHAHTADGSDASVSTGLSLNPMRLAIAVVAALLASAHGASRSQCR